MKAWNHRNRELLVKAIDKNKARYDVFINGVKFLRQSEGVEALEMILDEYDPTCEELAVKIYEGESYRSTTHTYGVPKEESGSESQDVFELRLKVQRLEDKLERERERHQDKVERIQEKLQYCEKALEVGNKKIETLQAKEKTWVNQVGNVKEVLGFFKNPPALPAAPQTGGAANQGKDEWADSLSGLEDLTNDQKEGVKDILCIVALDPANIETIKEILS